MRTKSNLLSLISIILLFLVSCDSKEELDLVTAWRVRYEVRIDSFRYGGIYDPFGWDEQLLFQNNVQWDEVTYSETNPQDFTINHYAITSADSLSLNHYIFTIEKDSTYHGKIIAEKNNIYFESTDGVTQHLYDFNYVIRNCIGRALRDDKLIPITLQLFTELSYPEPPSGDIRPICGWSFDYPFVYDNFGGVTMVYLGSTAGIFAPVENVPSGKKRVLLQMYRPHLFSFENRSYYEQYLYYINTNNPVSEYLPDNFWKEPSERSEVI